MLDLVSGHVGQVYSQSQQKRKSSVHEVKTRAG
jgi:hypothetical protein